MVVILAVMALNCVVYVSMRIFSYTRQKRLKSALEGEKRQSMDNKK